MMRHILTSCMLCMLFLSCNKSFAQNTGIGTITPHSSAILDLTSANKGFLPPRIALNALSDPSPVDSPATGLMVFNTGTGGLDVPGYYFWDGGQWVRLAAATDGGLTSIYREDDSLSGDRILHMSGHTLNFQGDSGSYSFGPMGNKISTSANELVLQQTGDEYGSAQLTLRNRAGENGLKISIDTSATTPACTDIIIAAKTVQRTIRLEERPGFLFGTDAQEMQIGDPSNSALIIGDNYIKARIPLQVDADMSVTGGISSDGNINCLSDMTVPDGRSYYLAGAPDGGSDGGRLSHENATTLFEVRHSTAQLPDPAYIFRGDTASRSTNIDLASIAYDGTLHTMGNLKTDGQLFIGNIPSGTASDSLLTVTAAGQVNKRSLATIGGNGSTIYTSDGTLTGNRTISQGSNTLTFSGTGNTMLKSGKVGMGAATSPVTTLDIRTADTTAAITVGSIANASGALFFGNSGHGVRRGFPNTGADNNNVGFYTTSGDLYLSSDGASVDSQFVLTNAGNIGIGTRTPTAKIHVAGNANITGNLTLGTIASGTAADSLLTISAGGVIHKRSAATTANIYSSNGALTGNRTVSQGSNTLTFSGTGNTLLQSGKVGIGTNTPAEALDVKGSIQLSSAAIPMSIYAENSGTTSPILNLGINFRESNKNTAYRGGAVRVDTRNAWPVFQFLSRNVGSATDNLVAAIDSNGSMQLGLVYAFPTSTTTPVHIDMGNTYSTTGGQNMKIGVLGSTYGFGVSNLQLDYMVPATGNHVFYVAGVEKMRLSAAGNLTVAGTITPSDKRLKSHIKPLDYGLQTILRLAPKQYEQVKTIQIKNGRPVVDPSNPKPYHTIGFIAQELHKVVPEAVHQPTDEANEIWGVDYTKMVPVLTRAIQEQQALIETLTNKNELLQHQFTTLSEQVKELLQSNKGNKGNK